MDFWIQLEETSLVGMVHVPQHTSALSPPDSNACRAQGTLKSASWSSHTLTPVRSLAAPQASALWLMQLYLGASKPHSCRLQDVGETKALSGALCAVNTARPLGQHSGAQVPHCVG